MAALASRHDEFLSFGARLFALSADNPHQNAHVAENLALPFPILSDPTRALAITPLGFADEDDPRRISLPGTVVLAPGGDEVWRHTGSDYADRPDEDTILAEVEKLDLDSTTQDRPEVGQPIPGKKAMPFEGLPHYFRGAKFAVLALRRRHRHVSEEFKEDTKRYVAQVERYLEALSAVKERKA